MPQARVLFKSKTILLIYYCHFLVRSSSADTAAEFQLNGDVLAMAMGS